MQSYGDVIYRGQRWVVFVVGRCDGVFFVTKCPLVPFQSSNLKNVAAVVGLEGSIVNWSHIPIWYFNSVLICDKKCILFFAVTVCVEVVLSHVTISLNVILVELFQSMCFATSLPLFFNKTYMIQGSI